MKKQGTVVRNIGYLAKKQGKRIRDVEDYCGVTAGYISRCGNESKKRLSLVLVLLAAEYLGTSIEELTNTDLAKKLEIEDIDRQIAELQKRKIALDKEVI